jgi:hypothetical protein
VLRPKAGLASLGPRDRRCQSDALPAIDFNLTDD